MDYKNLIVKGIADSGLPGSEQAKVVVEERVGMTLSDLDKIIQRAASLDIPVEEIIMMCAKYYTETHVQFLEEEDPSD